MRGPESARAPAAARAGARVERVLDRLLPHRPLARGPGGERAVPRALPERGAHRAAGHRPRLPARHPRRADPARARPLRPRPLRAGGRLRHLPGALGGARLRQGAGAAAGRDRAAGARGGPLEAAQRHRGRRAARRLAALAGAGPAGARRLGPAAPPVPAPGRHGHLHPAADRPLPGPAGGDGGAPDGAVGQGLLRRRRLPQDRPARAWGCSRRSSAAWTRSRARAASGSTCRGSTSTTGRSTRRSRRRRRWASSRSRAARRCRCCRARCPRTSTTSPCRWRWCGPGRSRAARCTPTSSAASALREDPAYQVPYEHPSLEPVLRDTLGAIVFQDQVIEVAMAFAGFSAGEAEGLRRAMSRKRSEAAMRAYEEKFVDGRRWRNGAAREVGRAGVRPDRRLLGLRLSQGALGGVRAAGLPVDLAAGALRAGVPVRAAERAADGLLPAGRAGARGAAAGDRGAAAVRGRAATRSAGWSRRRARGAARASAT